MSSFFEPAVVAAADGFRKEDYPVVIRQGEEFFVNFKLVDGFSIAGVSKGASAKVMSSAFLMMLQVAHNLRMDLLTSDELNSMAERLEAMKNIFPDM